MNTKRFAFLIVAAACLTAVCAPPAAAADEPFKITIGVEPGLRYDTPRFRVAPGTPVELTLNNTDQMMHNLVVTRPNARVQVINLALRLGGDGPAQHFVPKSDDVLWHTHVLAPDEKQTLRFTAPKEEGVYPYVCTYPGHGFVMFGAMYVQKADNLPPLDKDPNVPPPLVEEAGTDFLKVESAAKVVRDFLPDTGPASIAVGMPGGQSAVWDAGACRLRYVWSGGFIDIEYKKNDRGQIVGDVYYRAKDHEGLRIGSADGERRVEYLGYKLIDSFPQFRYRINGVEVKELLLVRAAGAGITRRFEIAETDLPVTYITDAKAGVAFESTKGTWTGGVLTLTPSEARSFVVSIAEPERPEPTDKPAATGGDR